MRNTIVALALGLALVAGGLAFAGEEAPAAKPAAETKTAPKTVAKKPETATPSPMHSILKWVGSHVADDCGCPSTEKGEKQWRTWFAAKDAKLGGLRDALVADGWSADKTIGFFKKMAASKGGDCSSCDKAKDCGSCDKAKSGGAAAPTGDAGTSGTSSKKAGCCGSCKGGCDKAKDCSSCDKSKSGGCDKSKAEKPAGATAPTGDAGQAGDAPTKKCGDGPCPCTGKPKSECTGGCGKAGCECGKKAAPSDK